MGPFVQSKEGRAQELKEARLAAAKKLHDLDMAQQAGFVNYIYVKKLAVKKVQSRKTEKWYDALDVDYITIGDGQFRQLPAMPAFVEQAKHIITSLEEGKFFRVVVDKRGDDQYWTWYEIDQVSRSMAKVLAKVLQEKRASTEEVPF